LERIVANCLAKDPDDRFQSAHDVSLQLQWLSTASGQMKAQPEAARSRKRSLPLLAALIAGWAVAIAAFILVLVYANRATSAQHRVHAQIVPPPEFNVPNVEFGPPALSPDGMQLALLTTNKNDTQGTSAATSLFLQDLQTGSTARIASAI